MERAQEYQPNLEFDAESETLNHRESERFMYQGNLLDNPELYEFMNEEEWKEFARRTKEGKEKPLDIRKDILSRKNNLTIN